MPIPYKTFLKRLVTKIPKSREILPPKSLQRPLFPALEKERIKLQKAQVSKDRKMVFIAKDHPYKWRTASRFKSGIDHEIRIESGNEYVGVININEFSGPPDFLTDVIASDVDSTYAAHVIIGKLQELADENYKKIYVYHVSNLDIRSQFRGINTHKIILKAISAITKKKKPALVYFSIVPEKDDLKDALARWYRSLGFEIISTGNQFYGYQIFT